MSPSGARNAYADIAINRASSIEDIITHFYGVFINDYNWTIRITKNTERFDGLLVYELDI